MSDDHEEFTDELIHYGIIRKSGRYPWGSGSDPYQRSLAFYAEIEKLKKKGLTDSQIAKAFETPDTPFNTTNLRATKSLAKDEIRAADRSMAIRLRQKGMGPSAIAIRMDKPESSIRALLKDSVEERTNITKTIADVIREEADKGNYVDVGKGVAQRLGVTDTRLKTAVALLESEGYEKHYTDVRQQGTVEKTSMMLITKEGTSNTDIYHNKADKIVIPGVQSEDGGRSFEYLKPPTSVNSKKLEVRYAEDGGTNMDGVIELRPGVKELDLGSSRYAQVRIAVDGTHYLKGMAVYANDLPDGVDIRFNTNKNRVDAPNKIDALKKMKSDDPKNPFESQIKRQRGALNILSEEGEWFDWSHGFSSQFLSKQTPELATRQLGLSQDIYRTELDEIKSLTNPTVKKALLEKFADSADAASTSLKAMGLPETRNHVILPIKNIKPKEIYAPNYKDGERVILIRHPHGGVFEIPELVVNNRSRTAKQMMGDARDAVGIHPSVAEQLSGADFDGDTVLVVPQRPGAVIKRSDPLHQLKDFDPKIQYKGYPGMKTMTNTQNEMGQISNLITDMSIHGASNDEIARAVRHSMVVIDAEKHGLNYKQSAVDNNIIGLKKIYQINPETGKAGGASTLISRSSSEVRVPNRVLRKASDGGPIDPKTGRKVWVESGKEFTNKKGERVLSTTSVERGALTDDANTLSSGTRIERIYAQHANTLKGMANEARRESLGVPNLERSPSAAVTYAPEVARLHSAIRIAKSNAPLERQAQLLAGAILKIKQADNPQWSKDDLKKARGRALDEARATVGAKKENIVISPREWEAIQSGGISNTALQEIMTHADLDTLRSLALPRTQQGVSPAKLARARAMAANGHTQAEIAEALGISTSTVVAALK